MEGMDRLRMPLPPSPPSPPAPHPIPAQLQQVLRAALTAVARADITLRDEAFAGFEGNRDSTVRGFEVKTCGGWSGRSLVRVGRTDTVMGKEKGMGGWGLRWGLGGGLGFLSPAPWKLHMCNDWTASVHGL